MLIEVGVTTLRDCIASTKTPKITWDSPWVTWNFPVVWDWNAWKKKSKVGAGFLYGQLTATNTSTRKVAARTLAKIMVEHVTLTTLQGLTHGVGYNKYRKQLIPILSPETAYFLRGVRGRKAKVKLLETLFQPFSMGAAEVDIDEHSLRDGDPIPRELAMQLENISNLIDLPSIDIIVKNESHTLKLSLIFQIYPLMVDTERRKAYFPIKTGFFFVPVATQDGQDLGDLLSKPWPSPESWNPEDKDTFWKSLLLELARLRKQFGPPDANAVKDAIVTINAKVKIPVDAADPEFVNNAIEKMLSTFRSTGEVIEMGYHLGDRSDVASPEVRLKLLELVQRVERASSADSKGNALEELIAGFLTNIPGFQVKQRTRTETEEIDLAILNANEDPRWRAGHPLILVECKNWSSSCGKNEIVQFKEKLENRRGRSTLGFLVSWNGFAETVTKELLRGSREQILIVPITGAQIRQAAQEGNILPTLQAAWDAAVMT